VAPASPPQTSELLDDGVKVLKAMGYTVRLGASVRAIDGYLSGSDECRADDINQMFKDPGVDAIFCTRGGYGSGRLLPLLDYSLIKNNPKIFVGYSDITSLSMAFLRKCGLVTFAGPMIASDFSRGKDEYSIKTLFSMITNIKEQATLPLLYGESVQTLHSGVAEGQLVGGNFAVLMTLLGTKYEPKWDGRILFVEDVAENVYKVDRMFAQLRNAGILSRLAGVLLGSFTCIPEDTPNRRLDMVFREYLLPLKIPVLQDVPFGHHSSKCTLPFGAKIRFDGGRRTIRVMQSVVR
jgi:muramoyltetrapeptide carboxypeptidase